MKRILLLTVLLLLCLPTLSMANPFLACDPMTPEVERIDVELNGQLIHVESANIIKRADAWLLVDLSTIGGWLIQCEGKGGLWFVGRE